jgi:hypothetical protein
MEVSFLHAVYNCLYSLYGFSIEAQSAKRHQLDLGFPAWADVSQPQGGQALTLHGTRHGQVVSV